MRSPRARCDMAKVPRVLDAQRPGARAQGTAHHGRRRDPSGLPAIRCRGRASDLATCRSRTTKVRRLVWEFFCQVVFWFVPVPCLEVCPGKASMFSRRQSCRGRSQSPVVRIAEEMETEPSKPIDKISRGESTKSPGCIKRERIVASKKVAPKAEPTSEGRRQHERPNTDRYGCSPRRGGSDGTVTRTC